ncbi:2Fe-2S iron-sulfur cluster-binding protein, partial [Pseudonocardia sp. MH-G8]
MTTMLPVTQQSRTVTASIDGRDVTVPEGTTIYDAAKQVGVEIPVLC